MSRTPGPRPLLRKANKVFEELTIATYRQRLLDGEITTRELVTWYLDRIDDHRDGRGMNAVVTVNPDALAAADACDQQLVDTGALSGPLHGVPMLIKDQAETAGIPTSFGNERFADYVPDTDAEVVTRLKDAGAIILGKSTMCDFAAGWFSSSSRTGHTTSAYDPSRYSGGSSAGSGAGVGGNLCLAAIGEDTGGSIRIPASFNNAYGMRVTTGLISRRGFSPLVHFQDTAGPMARTVDDLARVLDVIAGYDPGDVYTAVAAQAPDLGTYHDSLTATASADVDRLGDWSVGVLRTAFGDDATSTMAPVNRLIDAAVGRIGAAGANLVDGLEVEDLGDWIGRTSVYAKLSRTDVTGFLAARGDAVPVGSFDELYRERAFHPENDLYHDVATGPDDVEQDAAFLRARIDQGHFQRLMLALFASSGVDVLVYPTVQVIPPTVQDLADGLYTCLTFPTNTVIASQAGLPAVSVPAGFTDDGLPIGLEIVGRPFAESTVLRFAAAIETLLDARRTPSSVAVHVG